DFSGILSPEPYKSGLFPVTHWLYTQARVSDMDRSLEWYERVAGFRVVNELNLEGRPYELSTGIPGVKIRMVQGALGSVLFELVNIRSHDPGAAERIGSTGRMPAFTVGVADV